MERSARLIALIPLSALVLVGLNACTVPLREKLPPSIGKILPPENIPEQPRTPPPVPPQPVQPRPAPAPPVKREAQVYAYRDPSTVPTPPAPVAPSAAPVAVSVPVSPPAPAGSPPVVAPVTPAPGVAGTSPAAPPVQVATVDPRAVLPGASQPVAPVPTPIQPPAPAPTLPPSNLTMPNLPPAAGKLAAQAEQQRQAGDYAGAAATLERSLRIAPREAYLWNRLARLRLEQGQAVQAGSLAARANDLAGTQKDVKRDNWRIIAEAKRRAGDFAAANAAEQRAGGG